MYLKKAYIVLLFVLSCLYASGQNLEWINVITGDSVPGSSINFGHSIPNGLTVDTENNSYVYGEFQNNDLGTGYGDHALVKYNEKGEKCWGVKLSFNALAIEAEENTCDLYSIVRPKKGLKIGGKEYSPYSLLLLKTDSSFNLKWARTISDSCFVSRGELKITKQSLILSLHGKTSFEFKSNTYTSVFASDMYDILSVFLKLNKTGSSSTNEWITVSNSRLVTTFASNNLSIDSLGNVYSSFGKSTPITYINNLSYTFNDINIIKLNAITGKLEKVIELPTVNHLHSFEVLPNGKIFVSAWFQNNFNYKNITYTDTNRAHTGINLFLQNDGTPIWAVKEDDVGTKSGSLLFSHTSYRNGNLYLNGFIQHGNSSIGGFTLDANGVMHTSVVFGKMDTLGNVLWAHVLKQPPTTAAFAYSRDCRVDYSGNPIFAGYFSDSLSLLDTTIGAPMGTHTLLIKLSDYAIFRGNVYAGSYCAGDTIDIPYTLRGKFDIGNEFIAQLSDADGNFFGKERELGRVMSNQDGVVKGVLPLFNVNTSGKYRIRILSTKPAVQSYYRSDTLRLLIYSRDSANAGNDTLICQGQSIQLTTTGGSRWQWSPAASLDDSTLFKPTATPTADTRYRIIISDSSGCGDTDTDYVWVRLRKPLDIQTPFTDSTICRGQIVKLYATGTGGDSTQYNIAWYEKRTGVDVLLNANADSITTTSTQDPKNIFVVLTDNCTVLPDSQFISIKTLPALSVSIHSSKNTTIPFTDTLICYDADLKLYATGTGGNTKQHAFSWHDTGLIVNNSDSVFLPKAQPTNYYTILKDNCTARPDTAFVTVTQRLPLVLSIQANDSLCFGNTTKLEAMYSGGDSTQYQLMWSSNAGWASNQNPVQHTPSAITTYTATLKDNCSPTIKDSLEVKVFPLPTANFTFENTYGCPPLQVGYIDKSVGNTGVNNQWNIDEVVITNTSNATKVFSKTGTTTAKLLVTNPFGCSDSIAKSERITVFNKPKASFVVNPAILEAEAPVLFTSTSRGAIKYQWDLGDNTYRYSSGDTSYTYSSSADHIIRLVAENSLGCKDTAFSVIKVFNKVWCAVPSGFTPNRDGLNELFSPSCEGISDYTLTIYSRWGQVIYQAKNGAWDGTYADEPAPEGVYMYKIHLHAHSHKKSMVYGTINLIR